MTQAQREEFGKYLKTLRNAKNLTQRQAAEQAQVSAPYLTQLETGQRNPPSREILSRLAGVYEADEDRLFRAAGYTSNGEVQRIVNIDPRKLDWAFTLVVDDPEYALGTRMNKTQITPEVKAWAVELYLRTKKLPLLKPEDLAGLKEAIGLVELPTLESHQSGQQASE